MFIKYGSHTLIILLFSLFLCSCKTTKNRALNRAFHKTTTKYNGYFNAKQSYNLGVKKLEEKHKDDFNELLTIFPLGSEKEVQTIYPQMDKALKKCAQAISKHSMFIKGKEHNTWIDDCYLLIGKSYFYKREYIKAIEAFRLVSRQFEGNITSYESQLWLLRAFIETNDNSSVDIILDDVLSDESFPSKLNKDLALIIAYHHINQKEYPSAIEELKEVVPLTKNKNEKSRYLYILAQLNYIQKNFSSATEYFSKVIRISPNYEMTFNAKINRARSFPASSANSNQIKEELNKMIKDSKNKEFLDVIYFGLAELNKREGNIEKAISLYIKSTSKSIRNDAQKSLSSVLLADILYKQQDYRQAQAYYDTAVAFMSTTNERYLAASARQKTLTDLINSLDIIQHQDSLQKIAQMPEKKRNAFIDNIIQTIKEEEKRQKEIEAARRQENNFFNDPRENNRFNKMTNNNNRGGWYFSNPNTLSFGFSEFNRKWGKRKLEDNWRRADKKTQSVDEAMSDTTNEEAFDPTKRESYVRNLPLTVKEIQESNQKIIDAYFDAGIIYKEQLNDPPKSLKTFEALNNRFPKTKNRPIILYFLYRLHEEQANSEYSNDYKNTLLLEFPNSEYAKLIKDPSYSDELEFANTILNKKYEEAYELYLQSEYRKCIVLCEEINKDQPQNKLYPYFEFLKTVAQGSGVGKQKHVNNLSLIVEKYPKHPVSSSAKTIINSLQQEEGKEKKTQDKDAPYAFNKNTGHYFILLFKDFDLDVSVAKATISDYHAQYYRLERLNVSSVLFDQHTHMITVREFPNTAKAMAYYNDFQTGDVRGIFGENYDAFVISGPNFPPFFKNKDIDGYKKAFYQQYLKE